VFVCVCVSIGFPSQSHSNLHNRIFTHMLFLGGGGVCGDIFGQLLRHYALHYVINGLLIILDKVYVCFLASN